ncbi:MAG: DUF4405 domain-containing protein [Lachnospiraceae bacterium]|nr:DUF4405 domain-containing protein [Lachnospiraceae bacterium]
MQKRIRLIIDIGMTLLLPLLMAYSLIGEMFHEIVGTLIFILFIIHHVLNRKWFGSLFKGKYTVGRVFRTVINILLFMFMILQPVSGILMSKHLYTFLPVLPISARARGVHMLLSYWGFVLMCVHAGTHLTGAFIKIEKQKRRIRIPVYGLLCAISIYGCIAFVKRGFPGYMEGSTMFAFFDYSEPLIFFIRDYLSVMVLFMAVGCLVIRILSKVDEVQKKRRRIEK